MTREDEVRSFIRQLPNLSTTPAMLGRILAVAGDEAKSTDEICDMIARDQAMAQRVLKVANSALFAHSGQITDIPQAVLFLGLDRIRSIAAGMTVMHIFPAPGSFHIENLWIHSYEVAFLSSLLTERISIARPEEAFLAGLLHDIGRVILFSLDPGRFYRIDTGDTMLDQETELFGCTHADAGAWFGSEIGLPNSIVTVIRHHHHPSAAPDEMNLVSIVSLGEVLTRMFGPRIEDDGIWTGEHGAMLLEFSLSGDDLSMMSELFIKARPSIEQLFAPA